MRAAFSAGLVVVLLLAAPATEAQVRGALTAQPPSSTPGRASAPHPRSTIAWPWLIAAAPALPSAQLPPIAPGAPAGGVQLDVQPWSAEVYVDGTRLGRVERFRGYYQHLALPAGPHIIALIAHGYDPMIFGVTVIPGRTITYRATLQR